MQPAQRLLEIAAEVCRRNASITKGREPFAVEVLPTAIVIRLRPTPATLIDPEPQPWPVAPGKPISYMAGNRWHAAPDSDPWSRKP